MTDLKDLIARCKRATGGDREIDRAIDHHFSPQPARAVEDVALPEGFGDDWMSRALDPTPLYTSSIEAALAICERVLPGASYFLGNDWQKGDGGPCACDISNGTAQPWSASAPTLPLAIVLATLKALEKDSAE